MISAAFGLDSATSAGLLVDTNLLVLFAVGTVNRNRIETFKRTCQCTKADYDLLVRVLGNFERLYTVAHVLAEVSNLTDLRGAERLQVRQFLKETISLLNEAEMPSGRAVARAHNCAVLTDDLDLYLRLSHDNVNVVNFTHLRASVGGI